MPIPREPTFYRLGTDSRFDHAAGRFEPHTPVALEGAFGGPLPATCWLIGGGPSLARLPVERIARSPAPKMCVNLSGAGLLRPTFWTSYDPSARFHRSIYLDAGVMKFVHPRRSLDLVPGTTFKVCECPNTYFFDRDGSVGFHDFLDPARRAIVDWADSLVQAIGILYRLGFRRLLLAGTEMRVRPSEQQIEVARRAGVEYDDGLLGEFVSACEAAGVTAAALEQAGGGEQYHFGERKPLRAAAQTDAHYFRIAQYLRLSRRSINLAGMQLVSVTPDSRLNDHFPYLAVEQAAELVHAEVGDPAKEETRGLYREIQPRGPEGIGPMRDYLPHNWRGTTAKDAKDANGDEKKECSRKGERDDGAVHPGRVEVLREDGDKGGASRRERLLEAIEEVRRRRGIAADANGQLAGKPA